MTLAVVPSTYISLAEKLVDTIGLLNVTMNSKLLLFVWVACPWALPIDAVRGVVSITNPFTAVLVEAFPAMSVAVTFMSYAPSAKAGCIAPADRYP